MMYRPIISIFVLLLILTSGSQTYAQSDIPVSFPTDFISQFQDIYVDDSGMGYVVGKCGVLRKTDNAGEQWTTIQSPSDDDIYSVACAPGGCSKALLSTNDAMYLLVDDSWSEVTYPNFIDAGQIHWLTDEIVLHETMGQQYYRSTDGGMTWNNLQLADNQRGNMGLLENGNGYVFADSDLYKTTDQWASLDSVGYTHPVFVQDMTWLDENNGWLFDSDRLFYRTTDGGVTWTLLNDVSQLTSVNWMVALSETHLVGAQITTSRIESLDGGVTWSRGSFLPGGNERVNEKYHRLEDQFYLVGSQNQLLYSDSAFVDFEELDPFNRQDRIAPIAFASDDVGYALTGGELLVTIDAGNTWSEVDLSEFGQDLEVLDDGSLVVLGAGGSLISTDQGVSFNEWIPTAIIPQDEEPTKITQMPDGSLYLMSQNYGYASTDGVNFTAIQVDHGFTPSGLYFLDMNNGYAVGRQSQYMHTADGGQTWTIGTGPANNLVDIYFTDADHGWTSTASTRYLTSDRGITWTSESSTGGYDVTVRPQDGSLISAKFGSGNIGEIIHSTGNGLSWNIIAVNCYSYRAGALTPSGKYFFTGGDGFIVRHDLENLLSGTDKTVGISFEKISVSPNPTSGEIIVKTPSARQSSTIELYNYSDQLIRKIHVEEGQQSTIISLDNLDSGLYILRWTMGVNFRVNKVVKY